MIDGQRRRTLTGHWLTTRVLEEVGRVFSALRCTHRGRGSHAPKFVPLWVRNDFRPARAEHGGAEKDERKHSTARRGGALNSKVQVTQKPCVSTKYTLPKRPSATLRSESDLVRVSATLYRLSRASLTRRLSAFRSHPSRYQRCVCLRLVASSSSSPHARCRSMHARRPTPLVASLSAGFRARARTG